MDHRDGAEAGEARFAAYMERLAGVLGHADRAAPLKVGVLAELANGHVLDHPPAQRRHGFRAHGRLPSGVEVEPHDPQTERAAPTA
jgi:hypothetical protein